MEIMVLEIDSRGKKKLIPKLSSAGIVGVRVCNEDKATSPAALSNNSKSKLERLEVFVEKGAIGNLTKTLIKLGRDGFLSTFPVRIIGVRQAI